MLKVIVNYPNRDEELQILRRMSKTAVDVDISAVTNPAEILTARKLVDEIRVDEKVEGYIVDLIMATRSPESYGMNLSPMIQFGGSPRATINLALASKANAFLAGRAYVTPSDVRDLGMDILRHRVAVTYEAEAEELTSESIVGQILDRVAMP